MYMAAWSMYVWGEQFCYHRVIDWRLGSSVAKGSLLWEARGSPSWDQRPRRVQLSSFCVCVNGLCLRSDSVWQGVVGGWCSTASIWAQQWRVIEEICWGREACWRCFHLYISQILPVCISATAMDTFSANGSFVYTCISSFVCVYTHAFQYACVCLCVYFACVTSEGEQVCVSLVCQLMCI